MSHTVTPCRSCRVLDVARVVALALPLAACLGSGQPASAEGSSAPASIAPAGRNAAATSFEKFARSWMKKMRKLEERNRSQPEIEGQRATYRGYGEDFETELRPTRHPAAPYVGILRYTERLYSCADRQARTCSIASTTPVTEIFRYQGGRWIY